MAGSFAAVVSIGTALLLLAGIHSSQAGEINIVSPSAYKDTEGEQGTPENCCGPYRFQQVFPAEDFAALGNKPHWLVEITLRPDHTVTSPLAVLDPDCEIRLTTMPLGEPTLTSHFDDNLGSNFMQWYRGPQTQVADVEGPDPGPREFYHVDRPAGVTPFLYDPSQGNLLFDFISYQGAPSNRNDGTSSVLPGRAGSPFATEGGEYPAGIFQFTFIPVPEPSVVSIDLVSTSIRLRVTGVPGLSYSLERSPDLADPWLTINTQIAPASGLLEYLDTVPPPGSGFYRIVQP